VFWSQRYISEPSAILTTQTEIAEAVARALRLVLEPSPARARKKSHRVSEGSYELYLRGRDRAAAGDAAGALELYEHARVDSEAFAELDAAYADALYQLLSEGAPADPVGAEARLRAAARRAAAADPDLPQAALAQAMASAGLGESLEHVRRALDLDPSLGAAYRLVAHVLVEIDPERALRFAERALELDPGSLPAALDRVSAEAWLDRFHEANRSLESLRERLPDPADVRLSLSDDGRGMSPEVATQAFQPFFTTRLDTGGTGLGLHLVHKLVSETLGGSLEFDSQPGQGTRFDIRLPLLAPAAVGVSG
jgi:tetratricopeptide (TPR) repeat protein